MRPTLRQAVDRVTAATRLHRGRVVHAARQLQQAGAIPVAVPGSTAERLEPHQVVALLVAATCGAPIRAIADTTAHLLGAEVRGVDLEHVHGAMLGDVLTGAVSHRRPVRLSIDPAGTAIVIGWGDTPLEFGDPQPSGLSRTITISPAAFAAATFH